MTKFEIKGKHYYYQSVENVENLLEVMCCKNKL